MVSSKKSSGGSAVPLSQIEKSVTHLLVATKQLLETLTQWSRGNATDTQVSDVYVRLGYEFNMACRAFAAINVDTSDLGNVPELLRNILESTLSQEASVESLEKYLPKIRDIIISLLHGLKRKQQKLRQKQARDKENGVPDQVPANAAASSSAAGPSRTTSTSTMGSVNSGLTNLLNEGLENGYRADAVRDDARNSTANASPTRRFQAQREQSRGSVNSEQSSISSTTMQNIPVLPPYPGDETLMPNGPVNGDLDNFPPPPPPPKSQQSALAALQRGGDLERRASRRYSAYQISKHLGAQGAPIPMLPPQTTPIPNRGRGEVRESMRAMQTRENVRHKRNVSSQSKTAGDSSPVRVPSRVSEEPEEGPAELPASGQTPTIESPEESYFKPTATLKGPPTLEPIPMINLGDLEETTRPPKAAAPKAAAPPARAETPDKQLPSSFMLENSPPPTTKELTLFLQYKSKVKKFVLPEGYEELSIGRLQLAFIEKFSWNTQQNGADLPDIYIQDPVSGVRHELEDLSDIKDRTVLVLNVEPLDEVKKHIDEGLGSLTKIVQQVKQNIDEHGAAIQRVSERQQETAKDVARLAAAPPSILTPPADSPRSAGPATMRKFNPGQVSEIQNLRRDLAVLRQTYSNFQSEVEGSMSALRNKANNVKKAAAKAAVPGVEGASGQAYVIKGRKQLNVDSDRLVNKVDDLQDLVEDLRKDVVHRGVRPLPRQLEDVTKDITLLSKELKTMEDYMKQEKPLWTKIWEKELEDVCQGRDELRVMEDLMVDLRDDLEKASETFALVEQATKEQMKDAGADGSAPTVSLRQFSKGLNSLVSKSASLADPGAAKEGVLGEVRALQPNHEDRLEAIERAEKLRHKELESRRDNPLTMELTNFVGEGKLKKSGGFEEVERARKAKDDRIRREVWERQNGIVSADPPSGEAGADDGDGLPVV
ncbi:actin interacting protein 3-domain-containing protein [Lasiosphaeria miniovina]|uniref:Actin interacting protein 3-domain-containing protein n=1 Tax=Lasiosphaeria miniovina TaxID=1954250 RepID=A0AA39ZZ49_9PEZI|nr:actin interacting protein 3-domain-containing protein [Lasiosphaeria miniovina]KAK0706336.1 actin interacting protein 3-domain-containing protein [Lasiosphaeria miniovina]